MSADEGDAREYRHDQSMGTPMPTGCRLCADTARIKAALLRADTLREALRGCVAAMERWGAEEDGIPEDGPIASAYNTALTLLNKVK